MQNWEHQDRGKQLFADARLMGVKTACMVAPCGAGKSRIMRQLATEEVANGGTVRIYLHRTMLREQLSRDFANAGIDHGLMVAGEEYNPDKPIQICMTDSVYSRAVLKGNWDLQHPSLVLIDEAHNQTGSKMRAIVYGGQNENGMSWSGHVDNGAVVGGFTATPVGCGEFFEQLIDFGKYSEMRKVGAHLPVRVFAPSEIDTAGLQRNAAYEFSEKELEPRAYTIFGDAYQSWKKLNPNRYPAILFAPSVAASKWFAASWAQMGVAVAHLDGEVALLPRRTATGSVQLEQYDTTEEIRAEVMRMSKSGEIAMVTNRFVLREAIDMPWLYHGIFATVFGGVATYLQSVGRIQRHCADYGFKVLQDHGGSYWRHGSPNMDRSWALGDTNKSIAKTRAKQTQERPEVEGICCPKCFCWRQHGVRCPQCGHSHKISVRNVRQLDGELVPMRGVVNKAKKPKQMDANKIWIGVIYGSAKVDRSVSAAVQVWAMRCKDAGVPADLSQLKFRPPKQESPDWHLPVRKVFPWAYKGDK